MSWLAALIPLFLSLMQGQNNATQTQTTTATPTGYQSPMVGLLDMLMGNTLGQNLSVYGNAGLPGGMSVAPQMLPDFLKLISDEYYKLQGKYERGEGDQRRETRSSVGRSGLSASYGDYAGRS